uniref:Uncharacterized protein n=1 Tax=Cucumis melo TaxID=3656 RepID=A0A9I9DHE4_CUCME
MTLARFESLGLYNSRRRLHKPLPSVKNSIQLSCHTTQTKEKRALSGKASIRVAKRAIRSSFKSGVEASLRQATIRFGSSNHVSIYIFQATPSCMRRYLSLSESCDSFSLSGMCFPPSTS